MLSSTTIEHLKNRSRSGLLRTVFVNSGGLRRVHLAQNHQQSTRKIGLKVRVMLSICQFICSFCLFSAQRSEHETNHFAVNLHMSSAVNRSRGGFSRLWMVDSYVSRRFPMFHLKNRRTFTLFTRNTRHSRLATGKLGEYSDKS